MSKKEAPREAWLNIVEAYNNLFIRIFENKIFSDKDKEILKRVYQKLEEISALLNGLSE